MEKKTTISLEYGYTLTTNEDDTIFLTVVNNEGERLEFDGKEGNLIISCAWEEEDEKVEMTLKQMLTSVKDFFVDWDVDEEVADAIVEKLTPWFSRYAISEEQRTRMTIANLERAITHRRVAVERKMANIEADNKLISEAKERIEAESKKVVQLDYDIKKYERKIAELKASLNEEQFISIEPCYTGGNIYLFTGETTDGCFFMADTSFYDVRILNADPNEPTSIREDGTVWERNIDSVEWQEEHLVKDLTPDKAVAFFRQMLKWVEEHKPDGNYNMGDMEDIKEELDTLKGDWR